MPGRQRTKAQRVEALFNRLSALHDELVAEAPAECRDGQPTPDDQDAIRNCWRATIRKTAQACDVFDDLMEPLFDRVGWEWTYGGLAKPPETNTEADTKPGPQFPVLLDEPDETVRG